MNNCTFKTGKKCAFNTSYGCTFDTGTNCSFKTGYGCTFKTGWGCSFKTGWNCSFKTGEECSFNTDEECSFKTGKNCVIIRRDIFEVIIGKTNIKTNPSMINGHIELIDDKWYLNGDKSLGEHIIADGILSKIVKKKG